MSKSSTTSSSSKPAPTIPKTIPDGFLDPLFARETKNERIIRVKVCDFEKRTDPKYYVREKQINTQ